MYKFTLRLLLVLTFQLSLPFPPFRPLVTCTFTALSKILSYPHHQLFSLLHIPITRTRYTIVYAMSTSASVFALAVALLQLEETVSADVPAISSNGKTSLLNATTQDWIMKPGSGSTPEAFLEGTEKLFESIMTLLQAHTGPPQALAPVPKTPVILVQGDPAAEPSAPLPAAPVVVHAPARCECLTCSLSRDRRIGESKADPAFFPFRFRLPFFPTLSTTRSPTNHV